MLGRIPTERCIAAIRAANTGKPTTEKQRIALEIGRHIGGMRGKKHSSATKARMRESHKALNFHHTEETKRKIGAPKIGKPRPESVRQKLRNYWTAEEHRYFLPMLKGCIPSPS
jgi:hypothetical protein